MLIVNYSTNGQAVRDFEVEYVLSSKLNDARRSGRDVIWEVATENAVLMTRVWMAEGAATPDNVRIIWNGQDMFFDNRGRFLNFQNSFNGLTEESLSRLLNARTRRDRG